MADDGDIWLTIVRVPTIVETNVRGGITVVNDEVIVNGESRV